MERSGKHALYSPAQWEWCRKQRFMTGNRLKGHRIAIKKLKYIAALLHIYKMSLPLKRTIRRKRRVCRLCFHTNSGKISTQASHKKSPHILGPCRMRGDRLGFHAFGVGLLYLYCGRFTRACMKCIVQCPRRFVFRRIQNFQKTKSYGIFAEKNTAVVVTYLL